MSITSAYHQNVEQKLPPAPQVLSPSEQYQLRNKPFGVARAEPNSRREPNERELLYKAYKDAQELKVYIQRLNVHGHINLRTGKFIKNISNAPSSTRPNIISMMKKINTSSHEVLKYEKLATMITDVQYKGTFDSMNASMNVIENGINNPNLVTIDTNTLQIIEQVATNLEEGWIFFWREYPKYISKSPPQPGGRRKRTHRKRTHRKRTHRNRTHRR